MARLPASSALSAGFRATLPPIDNLKFELSVPDSGADGAEALSISDPLHDMPDLSPVSNHLEETASATKNAGESRRLPLSGEVTSLPQLCAEIHRRLTAFLAEEVTTERLKRVQEQTRISMGVIGEALQQYQLHELSLSYNGGKDCLVLLILYLGALHNKFESISSQHGEDTSPQRIHSVYIQAPHPFPEVEAFVEYSVPTYSLDLVRYAKPMKAAFADYLAENPSIKAIFVGTRRTDPHGEHLTHFDPTDSGWPSFMRIHPVIDWHYVEIWTFIRHLNIPYCSLYDQGYTSLGGTNDTLPNPALKKNSTSGRVEGSSTEGFRPAYELVEDNEERLGRDR